MLTRTAKALSTLIALLLCALGVLSVPATAHAEEKPGAVSWTVRTALSKYGSGRAKFTYTVKRGEQLTDGIDIANRGAKPITLKVYAADGFTTDTGGFDLLTPDKRSTGIGAWTKPAVSRITIPAGEQVQVPFTVTVPDTAAPGDHLGGIVSVLDQPDSQDNRTVIHQRVGLRLVARVTGKVAPALRVERVSLQHEGSNPFGTGRTTVSYTVHNTGNTVLGGLQSVAVGGAFGLSSRTVKGPRLPDLLPGERWDVKVPVDDVRVFLWVSATVSVTPVVTDAAGSTTTLDPVRASARSFSVWSLLALLGLLLLAALLGRLVVLSLRRRRGSAQAKVDAKVAAAVQDALREKASR